MLNYPDGTNHSEDFKYGFTTHEDRSFSVVLYSLKNPEKKKTFNFSPAYQQDRVRKHFESLTDTLINDFLKEKK